MCHKMTSPRDKEMGHQNTGSSWLGETIKFLPCSSERARELVLMKPSRLCTE